MFWSAVLAEALKAGISCQICKCLSLLVVPGSACPWSHPTWCHMEQRWAIPASGLPVELTVHVQRARRNTEAEREARMEEVNLGDTKMSVVAKPGVGDMTQGERKEREAGVGPSSGAPCHLESCRRKGS